jgi:hypothetical protein
LFLLETREVKLERRWDFVNSKEIFGSYFREKGLGILGKRR